MKCSKLTLAIASVLAMGTAVPALAGTITFDEAPVPYSDAEKRDVLASKYAIVDGRKVYIDYNTILRSGDAAGRGRWAGVFGQLIDVHGDDLVAEDGSKIVSNSNDFSSLVKGEDGQLYMVSQFENRPGAMYLTQLKQNRRTGELTAKRTRALDFSEVKGGWVHCAGSVTPWGTHLGSEEYEPDAKQWIEDNIDSYNAQMATYFGADPSEALTAMNPYDYGYPVEVKVKNFHKATIAKHYAMGRIALELAYVMPDDKTSYLTDDGTNVGLFRFVADEAGDLSAGTLWVAQWSQKSATGIAGMGEAKLNWINLGHATNAQVEEWIGKYTFADIFDYVEPDAGVCADGYTSINAGHEDGKHQCLKLKDVNGDGVIDATDEAIASRLETRRWAAMEGGTTEFRKMEGITFNPDEGKLYLAMSEVDRGMLDNARVNREDYPNPGGYDRYDIGGWNHMTLEKGNVCGGVYAMDVDGSYTATNMYGLVAGTPLTVDYGADVESPAYDGENKCDLNGIANPDNVTYMPGYDTLIIGEDTGSGHQNDMIWAYNVKSGQLTRIQTTPYGSETTSPYFYPNINGFAYLMSVIQHPYGESDSDKLIPGSGDERGYTGYIGPFPAMDGERDRGRGHHKGHDRDDHKKDWWKH
jgi:secreted PhoX family phosphatase